MKKTLLCTMISICTLQAVNAQNWLITGNAGTTSANFLGTTDAQALRFKTNNQLSGLIDFSSVNANTGFGFQALKVNTGNNNAAFGYKALTLNTSGRVNTASGAYALYNNTTGYSNVGIGIATIFFNKKLNNLVALGDSALYNNNSGPGQNTAIGSKAMYANTGGYYNTALGYRSLFSNSTGYSCTAIGYEALYRNSFGENNTAIGYSANANAGTYSNSTAVGFTASITASDQVRIGNASVTSIGGYANWTNISDGRVKKNIKQNVPGLSFINKLIPVTYNLDLEAADKIIQMPPIKDKSLTDKEAGNQAAEDLQARKQKEQVVYTGFIAQQVEKAAKELSYDFSGVDAAKNTKDLYGLRYSDFVVPLVKAVQELSSKNDELSASNDALKNKNKDLEQRVSKLEAMMNAQPATSNTQLQTINNSTASLEQNMPNPFSGVTAINYYLPSNNGSSYINLYSQSGTLLRSIKLSGVGKNSITLSANELAAGTYTYALVIDGNVAASKQLVLTK